MTEKLGMVIQFDWIDVKAGWRERRRWGYLTFREGWDCGWWDYRAGWVAATVLGGRGKGVRTDG